MASRLSDAVRLYFRYAALSLRSQLQYRAALVMQIVGHFLMTGVEFLAIWALFDRFGNVAGWTLPEVALLYGMVDVSFAFADALARGFDLFGTTVRSGDFDRLLLRPRSTVLQLLGQELTVKRIGRLVQGLVVLAWASHAVVHFTPGRVAVLLFAVAGAICLFVGIEILQATSAFWTVEALEIWNAFSYGGNAAAQYPMSIYRRWFQRLFTLVIPLACVIYLPALVILGRRDDLLFVVAPLTGVAFLGGTLLLWRVGVRHYAGTGS